MKASTNQGAAALGRRLLGLLPSGPRQDSIATITELAEVVDMKFFCGFSFAEIAAMRDLSERTVKRRWQKARTYLHRELRAEIPALMYRNLVEIPPRRFSGKRIDERRVSRKDIFFLNYPGPPES
jgi:hypothetical protein